MQIPRRKSELLSRKDEGPFYITEEGLEQLKRKLARLRAALPGYIEEAMRTAAYGDRSDNAEYKDAKATLRRTRYQIFEIGEQIKTAVVIKQGAGASGKIGIGSTVVLEINGKKKTFQILGSQETNPTEGKISYKSPLGAALMDRVAGDRVAVKIKTGDQEYLILEVR